LAQLARLKRRQEFLAVAASGRKFVAPGLILQARRQPTDGSPSAGDIDSIRGEMALRIGFTASRKVGNAVLRNRAKRRLRAIAAEVLPRNGRPGTDYVIVARATSSERRYADLVADLETALRQLDRQKTGGGPPKRVSAAAED
jgi:ribonuclease P protein component